MMKSTLGLFITVAIFLPIPGYPELHSSDEVNNWKTECVGRYQISVPGEAENALKNPKFFTRKRPKGIDIDFDYNEFIFSDKSRALFSRLITEGGEFSVTPILKKDEIAKMKIEFNNRTQKRIAQLRKEGDKDAASSIHVLNTNLHDGYMRVSRTGATIYLQYEDRIFNQSGGIENLSGKYFAQSFLEHFHPRTLYSLPNQPGICIPYGFIADDGTAPRDIGVTMRLIDHPDVEIFFRDTAGYLSGGTLHKPKEEIEYFWTIMYQKYTKLTEADFWGYRSIKMGGQSGKGMFVTIHRYDDSIDYGYIAVVSDNANLPSQMLYVIRTAARAKGKPVSKEELKDIAEKIMASVKPHAVQ
jgi:hypothetical protein